MNQEVSRTKFNATIVSIIFSTALILGTFLVAWGSIQTQISILEKRMTTAEEAIRAHHEDVNRHVDMLWKEQVMSELAQIRALLMEHANKGK